ncbi:MAG: sulfatase/phosphatase domain-containing protein, partial [Rhodopirellula bahusiensis]
PTHTVREYAFSVAPMRKGFLIRTDRWAYIQYKEDASGGIELFDMETDPKQFTNLATSPDHQDVVAQMKQRLTAKLTEVRSNDLATSSN